MFARALAGGLSALLLAAPSGAQVTTASENPLKPNGSVLEVVGALYGSAVAGGPECQGDRGAPRGCGAVYRIERGSLRTIHQFSGPDGGHPTGGLAMDRAYRLYGTTSAGGSGGQGVLFSVAPDGADFSILHEFVNGYDNGQPVIGLDGTVYGAFSSPSSDGADTVYSIAADRTFRVVHAFGLGWNVPTPLALDMKGRVYGLAAINEARGAVGCGEILFAIEPSGSFAALRTEMHEPNSPRCKPLALPLTTSPLTAGPDGFLYTTSGTAVFRISPGSESASVVYRQPAASALSAGSGGLGKGLASGPGGALYGTTGMRADGLNCGSVYRLTPSGVYSTVHAFAQQGGACYFRIKRNGRFERLFAFPHRAMLPGFAENRFVQLGLERVAGRGLHARVAGSLSEAGFKITPAGFAVTVRPYGQPSAPALAFVAANETTLTAASTTSGSHPAVTLALRGPALDAGLYEATFALPPLLAQTAGGERLHVYPRVGPDGRFYVPAALNRVPSLHVGQTFTALPLDATDPVFTDVNGEWAADHVLSIVAVDSAVRLRVRGSGRVTKVPAADVESIVGLTPLVDDGGALDLRRAFAGRRVWGLGGVNGFCAVSDGRILKVSLKGPLRITGIVRAFGRTVTRALGPLSARAGSGFEFSAIDPLIVTFEPHLLEVTFAGGEGGAMREAYHNGAYACAALYTTFADPWELDRAFSLVPPANPGMVGGFLAGPHAEERIRGMTYDAVAAILGYPPVYGTAAEMKRLDAWHYNLPSPSAFTVYFEHGRVVKYDPPGEMP